MMLMMMMMMMVVVVMIIYTELSSFSQTTPFIFCAEGICCGGIVRVWVPKLARIYPYDRDRSSSGNVGGG
jgi:hypothetical protein